MAYASRILPQYKERVLSHESQVERYTKTVQGYPELVALLNTLSTDLEPIENLRKDLKDVVSELTSALSEVDEVANSLRMSTMRIRSEVETVREAALQRVPEARLPKPQMASQLLSRISAAEQDLLRQHFLTQGALATRPKGPLV